MNTERYARTIRYKAELDNAWKTHDPLNPYNTDYEKLLSEVKIAGYKVLRDSRGDHKLIDKHPDATDNDIGSIFADVLRRRG